MSLPFVCLRSEIFFRCAAFARSCIPRTFTVRSIGSSRIVSSCCANFSRSIVPNIIIQMK